MKEKFILIIPVIEEHPDLFLEFLEKIKLIKYFAIFFAVSPKSKFLKEFKFLSKSNKICNTYITDKQYKRSILYQKTLSYVKYNFKKESDNYEYVLSIKKFDYSYTNLIIEGLLEIKKTSLDVVYCLSNKNKKSLKAKIKKSVLDMFKSQLFIASYNFVNIIYANPFNKIATFYFLLRNAKSNPSYYK